MSLTIAEFLKHLRPHNSSKPVCFCRCPEGLQFFRFKRRGPHLLQIEFNESIYRNGARLIVEFISPPPEDPKTDARTVAVFLDNMSEPELQPFELVFGGDHEALKFSGIEDFGDWISINFEQRVYRGENASFIVEETRDGQPIREEFPMLETRDPSEARTGAFRAIRDMHPPKE
jgi:hypothetical protein